MNHHREHHFGGAHHGRHERHALRMAGRGRGGFLDDGEELGGGRRGHRHGRGGRPGRMFGQGDLKLLLLSLIAEQPRHGYELIRAIEDLCGGGYSPSPGAIYPSLTYLDEAGYIALTDPSQDAKKKYAITAEGQTHLEQNRVELEAVRQQLTLSARMMAKLSVPEGVRASMQHLKAALLGHDRAWDKNEIRRVKAIIEQAAQDIMKPEVQ